MSIAQSNIKAAFLYLPICFAMFNQTGSAAQSERPGAACEVCGNSGKQAMTLTNGDPLQKTKWFDAILALANKNMASSLVLTTNLFYLDSLLKGHTDEKFHFTAPNKISFAPQIKQKGIENFDIKYYQIKGDKTAIRYTPPEQRVKSSSRQRRQMNLSSARPPVESQTNKLNDRTEQPVYTDDSYKNETLYSQNPAPELRKATLQKTVAIPVMGGFIALAKTDDTETQKQQVSLNTDNAATSQEEKTKSSKQSTNNNPSKVNPSVPTITPAITINHPPVMGSLTGLTVTEGQSISFNVNATDPDLQDSLTLTAFNLPAFANFQDRGQGRGAFYWLPVKQDAGVYSITFKVQDNRLPSASDTRIMIINVNSKPNISPLLSHIGDQETIEGQRLRINIHATDADLGDKLTLKVNDLPRRSNYIFYGNGNGTITWNPSLGTAGEYPVTVTVSDLGMPIAKATETFKITVKPAAESVAIAACQQTEQIYLSQTHNDLISSCSGCHKAGGIGPGFELTNDASNSFKAINQYVTASPNNARLFLSKPIGIPFHGGGSPFVNNNDNRYLQLQSFLQGLPCDIPTETNQNTILSLQEINLSDKETTLRKAAKIFAGRLPTAAEVQQADTIAGLAATVRSLMSGDSFADYIYRAGNEWFLTAGSQFKNYELNFGTYDRKKNKASSRDRQKIYAALRREPLELLRFIVENDRPYSEIVTADYTMVNPALASLYAAVDAKLPGITATDWKPARIRSASKDHLDTPYPHAGVLSTVAWLSRFPTTDTNRNRHRVNMMYRQFLAFDIESLGQRPSSDADGGDFLVPVMENSTCTSCHSFMDPAAGTFMDFGPDNRYRTRTDHALAKEYTNTRKRSSYPKDHNGNPWYQQGDKWYRDVFAPGFESINMPGNYTGLKISQANNGGQSAMGWMTRELVSDPRFAKGTVYFWYRSIFARDPLAMPINQSDPNYTADMEAYNFQNNALEELAQKFQQNGMIIRDLLVDFVLSPLFRGDSVTKPLSKVDQQNLADIGMNRLQTVEEIDKITRSITNLTLFKDYNKGLGLMYGGFDGGLNMNHRNRELTPTMAGILDSKFNKLLCGNRLVVKEFRLPKEERVLLKFVESSDVPNDTQGREHILQNIQFLHHQLLGESLPLNDIEVQATLSLFEDIIANTSTDMTQASYCEGMYFDNNNQLRGSAISDPEGTIRAWNSVLLYLFGDFKYLNN